jgi:RNA polymerase sigma factor (sigma-70 family)
VPSIGASYCFGRLGSSQAQMRGLCRESGLLGVACQPRRALLSFIGVDGMGRFGSGGRQEHRLAARASGQQGGDRDFEEFFDATWARAVRMVSRMGLNRQDAEDVVLDAMAVVYDRWGRVRALPYRESWMLKVAANRARRQLKRANRRGHSVPGVPLALEEEIATKISVRDGISRLPRRQQEVIALRYLADMPEDQVAEVLGLNPGTVKQHASRGRAALRVALGDEQPWEGGHAG